MMKIILQSNLVLLALFTLSACPGGKGWPQGERDKVINSCVQKAKAGAPQLDEAKLNSYCSCYQQNLEKKFPSLSDLGKANVEDLTKEAETCLPLMFK